ncbi:MAG: T9SS type A sorting domain-containing protein [Flavobacterium sp.]|nr:T9SS type A sorting domain-containing protein [Flavobacterium sp.]
MKKFILLVLFSFLSLLCVGQTITKKVLFLGNSYTYSNDLPQLIANAAQSTNDVLLFDSNTPGGYRLQDHNSNSTSLSKIAQGNWDFVVLQEQSQLPSFPINQVNTQVFPYATSLNNLIISQNPCAETVFFMTWGRQNGDSQNCAVFPSVCTYEGMDDLLRERYMTMTINNQAIVSPVGAVWRYLRTHSPELNLYVSDGSHPSLLGSYAAACTFYTTLFRKDPTLISFNSSLTETDANTIKAAVKAVVFDHLTDWQIGNYDPNSNFSYSNSTTTTVQFYNSSTNATSFLWNFGDTTTSTEANPVHSYTSAGEYFVTLTATKCDTTSVSQQTINTSILDAHTVGFEELTLRLYPNPVGDKLFVECTEKILRLELYDVLGRLLKINTNETTTMDLSAQKTDVYFVKVITENGVKVEKVIKN